METTQMKKIGNMELHSDENYVVISLNPEIYPFNIVKTTSDKMRNKALVEVNETSKKEITIELRPKEKDIDIEELGREFNNELINHAAYKIQADRNKALKEVMAKEALTTKPEIQENTLEDEDFSKIEENLVELEQSSLEDPLGISEPWGDTGIKAKSDKKSQESISAEDIISIDKTKSK